MEFKTQIPLWFKYHSGIYYSFHRTTNIQKRDFRLEISLLGYPDSNQERQDQNLQCYHYTIAQGSIAMQRYNFFR